MTSELREALQEDVISFVDDLNHHIFDMVSSSDVNEKKGGILAIVSLLQVDVGNTNARMTRFANYLKNLLPSQDVVVMELTARALGKLTLASVSFLYSKAKVSSLMQNCIYRCLEVIQLNMLNLK